MLIFDAHLDLAYNATLGRDLTKPAEQQPPDEEGIPAVGLPDLAGAAAVCATIFCEPASARSPQHGYQSADEAHAMGQMQMNWYQQQRREGRMMIIKRPQELAAIAAGDSPRGDALPAIILLEGADGLRNDTDVAQWFDAGMRIVALAWHRTRLAGGTGEPGPLRPKAIELVRILDRFRIIHDISHLAEEAFWQLLDLSGGPVIASHSNCRSIIPTDRHLSDEMIRAGEEGQCDRDQPLR